MGLRHPVLLSLIKDFSLVKVMFVCVCVRARACECADTAELWKRRHILARLALVRLVCSVRHHVIRKLARVRSTVVAHALKRLANVHPRVPLKHALAVGGVAANAATTGSSESAISMETAKR